MKELKKEQKLKLGKYLIEEMIDHFQGYLFKVIYHRLLELK
jgi:hypothetical protein